MKRVLQQFLTRVTIVHSLPGRVRFHVPALARIPTSLASSDSPWIQEFAQAGLRALNGITAIRVTPATAGLLVTFEPNKVREDQVVELVRAILDLIVEHADRFAELEPEAQVCFLRRLGNHLSTTTIRPGTTIELPHDLWTDESA